jgi:hypothetical protein
MAEPAYAGDSIKPRASPRALGSAAWRIVLLTTLRARVAGDSIPRSRNRVIRSNRCRAPRGLCRSAA